MVQSSLSPSLYSRFWKSHVCIHVATFTKPLQPYLPP
ncbi:hypothetical protein NC651_007194 [Populus alba x Populus x berolinensis]|nr:hypothetical protein NC651_007194 [Populus alba x Populus x berolinensis]